MTSLLRSLFIALCAWLGLIRSGVCAEILYVETGASSPYILQDVQAATNLYGVDLNVISLTSADDESRVVSAIADPATVGVVMAFDALPLLQASRLLDAIRTRKQPVPLMIAGIAEQADAALLGSWSGQAIDGCGTAAVRRNAVYDVAAESQIAHQLGGKKLPLTGEKVRYLRFRDAGRAEWIIAADDTTKRYPVFARTVVENEEVFFATAPADPDLAVPLDQFAAAFAVIAPEILFVSHAAGEKGWHTVGHYANFTVDDAWLREPYGYLQYDALVREMESHRFHTTIAFIPWNYDRSQADVVALFRAHPDVLSICVHGNNHDHQEFGPLNLRPLAGQINDIGQGLGRMAAFTKLTGVPYDPIMVFPHKISPQETFSYLKRFNIWATVNGEIVPSDAAEPPAPTFPLRTVTLAFADFPSVRRYSAEHPIPDHFLAIDAYLGNPLLFYGHQAFFAKGIGAFDALADQVNRLQPDTQWRSLGYIVQHSYLQKLRDDGNYDVQLLSGVAELTNTAGRDVRFYVEKEEDGAVPFTVSVDGRSQPFQVTSGVLRLQVTVPRGGSRDVAITYNSGVDLGKVDIAKNSLRIATIRYLSDFRDDTVSRSAPGRWFIGSYVAHGFAWNFGGVSGLCGGVIVLLWYMRAAKRRRPHEAQRSISTGHSELEQRRNAR